MNFREDFISGIEGVINQFGLQFERPTVSTMDSGQEITNYALFP